MSGSKFFIWGGERWRELNTETGEVEGWFKRARFVSVRRGRLRVCARRRVLSALQAHAVGQPSAVSLGPRLSMLSKESVSPHKENTLPSALPVPCGHHHCCLDSHRCHTNNNCGKTCRHDASAPNDWSTRNGGTIALANGDIADYSTPNTNDAVVTLQRCNVTTQQSFTVDVAVQHAPHDHRPFTIHLAEATGATSSSIPQRHIRNSDTQKQRQRRYRYQGSRAPPLETLLRKHTSPIKRARASKSDSEDSENSFRRPSKTRRRKEDSQETVKETRSKNERSGPSSSVTVKREERSASESTDGAAEVCKELTISESDVLALRSYVARTRRDALARFDADDAYKRMLFYAINPLVDVERCAHTERALRERHAMALPHYAARLGLVPQGSLPLAPPSPRTRLRAPVRYYDGNSSPDTDKENKQNTKNDKKRNSNTKTMLRTKPNVDDSDSNVEYNVFRKSSDKKRGSTPKKTKNRVENSDSDDESDLFENSRNHKGDHRADVKSSKQSRTRKSGSETVRRQNVKVRDKESSSRKSILAGKKVSATEESDNDKILSSRLDNDGRHEKNNDKICNDSRSISTNQNRKILGKANKNRHESNQKSNERKRDAKSDPNDSENDENRKSLEKRHDKRENYTSNNNRRESLRHRNVEQAKTSSDDSETNDKRETLKKNESKLKTRPPSGEKRGILRQRRVSHTKTSSDDSDSDESRETLKKSEEKRVIPTSSGNKRQILRRKTVTETTTSSDDTESDAKGNAEGKRENRAPIDNKRSALRHRPVNQTKISSDDSDSDEQRETFKKNESKRRIHTSSGNRREVMRHKTGNPSTTSSDDSESDEKRKTVKKSEGKHDSRVANGNRRESLRHRPVNQTKSSADDSASDEKRKTAEKIEDKHENRAPSNKTKPVLNKTKEPSKVTNRKKEEPIPAVTELKNLESDAKRKTVEKSKEKRLNRAPSDDRRESLRHRPMNHANTSSDISDSDEKRETVKKTEAYGENRAPSNNRRESLRHRPVNHANTSSDISDSDEKRETVKKAEAKRENRAPIDNRRESLRHRPMNNTKTSPDDSKSIEKLKNFERNDGKRENVARNEGKGDNPAPSNSTIKPVHTKTKPKATNREEGKSVPAVAETKEINTKRVSNSKLKEYSNLEDHAIVAWVANGARARRVNGNALWRELQNDFARLAGNSRTWHSLRNRYLRYILPAMGAMRLPPAEVSRLRAAAATGEIKHKRAGISEPRRNSIFDQPSVKAASRPKRAPPTPAKAPPTPAKRPPSPLPGPSTATADSSDEPSEAGPSGSRSSYFVAPRAYPDVRDSPQDEGEAGTSTFRRRSRRSQVSLPSPAPLQSSRGRKLFNPKQVL